MQPWRISVGLSAALVGSGLLLGGSRLEYLAPFWPVILAEHGIPIVLHSALVLGAVAAALYAVARAAGLADLGGPRRSPRALRTARRGRSRTHRRVTQGRRGRLGVNTALGSAANRSSRPGNAHMIDRTSIEILPADWRTRAKTLRRYGGKTPAVALEACAAELETALRQRDDTILTLTEAAVGKAATPPLTWDAWCARAGSQTPEGPAHPGSLEGTSPMRPGRWPSLVWRRSLPCARFPPGRSCSASSRRVSDDGTKRSRTSYSAGERSRNRVLVFPDPRTGLIQIEWREGGRRLAKSLGHRDWDRAKRQADAVAASAYAPRPAARPHPCPCSYPSAHFERRSLLLLNSAAFPLSASTRFTITCTCGCPPRCATISAWCFCSPSAFRLSVACPGSTLPLRRHPWPSYRHMDATTNSLALHYHRISS